MMEAEVLVFSLSCVKAQQTWGLWVARQLSTPHLWSTLMQQKAFSAPEFISVISRWSGLGYTELARKVAKLHGSPAADGKR